jgi:hypothetical protein
MRTPRSRVSIYGGYHEWTSVQVNDTYVVIKLEAGGLYNAIKGFVQYFMSRD